MKLQAVTVCINYSDYLQCILANRRHFDRWVIMTVPFDSETIGVCERHQLEYRLSRSLAADGADFDAAYNKSAVLNEGLELLDQEGWALILDADVLLPRDFRERLNAYPLPLNAICGTAGRRMCGERAMFEMLARCEPWEYFCERHPTPYGFFQLFHLEQPMNRYLPSNPLKQGPADDDRFQLQFPAELHRTLPITVIHVGVSYKNWSRREIGRFDEQGGVIAEPENDEVMWQLCHGDFARVAFLGYYPGMRAIRWLKQWSHVDLLDHFGIHQHSEDPLIEADRAVLRSIWARETAHLNNLYHLGSHSRSSIERIPSGSLDLLYLAGEPLPEWLTAALPLLLEKVRDDAVICGEFMGLPHWPDSTYAVTLLLGTPDEVTASGFWWRRIRRAATDTNEFPHGIPLRVEHSNPLQPARRGIVLVGRSDATLSAVFMTIHSLRQHWAGGVTLYHWGERHPFLAIACARYGVELQHVGIGFVTQGGRDEDLVWEAMSVAPFERALFLPIGTVVVGCIESLFNGAIECASVSADTPHLVVRDEGAVRRISVEFASAREFKPAALLICRGPADEWAAEVWETWCQNEAATITALACVVRVPPDTMIITIVNKSSLADFERNWLDWKFSATTLIWVLLEDLEEHEVWFANGRAPDAVISLRKSIVAEGFIEFPRPRVAVLSPLAKPLPGARLDVKGQRTVAELVVYSIGRSSNSEEGAVARSEPLFAVASRRHLSNALREAVRVSGSEPVLSTNLRAILLRDGHVVETFDARRLGWRFSSPGPF